MELRMVSRRFAVLLGLLAAAHVSAQTDQVQWEPHVELPPANMLDSASAWQSNWTPPGDCLTSVQTSNMARELVSLDARMAPRTDASITLEADLIAKDVAAELRTMLGGSDSLVPDAAAHVKWYSIPAELIVTARPDGRMTWRGASRSGDTSASSLLATALDSARRHGGALMIWPDGNVADSLVVRLSLLSAAFHEAQSFDSLYRKRLKFKAFAMSFPTEAPALPIYGRRKPTYPQSNQMHRVSGTILAQFVVDTSGRAVMSSFRDLWPPDKPRLTGDLAHYYDEFLASIREFEAGAKFSPARVGACKIRQIVQAPFEFVLAGNGGAHSK
jgi:hypothetical protein